jgi:hypothetical protein
MKNNHRKSLAALVLVLAFSSSTFADDGIMWPEHAPPPPPPANVAMQTEIADDGIIQTGEADALTEIGLSLLQVLSQV